MTCTIRCCERDVCSSTSPDRRLLLGTRHLPDGAMVWLHGSDVGEQRDGSAGQG